jgi:hypothetical protein
MRQLQQDCIDIEQEHNAIKRERAMIRMELMSRMATGRMATPQNGMFISILHGNFIRT